MKLDLEGKRWTKHPRMYIFISKKTSLQGIDTRYLSLAHACPDACATCVPAQSPKYLGPLKISLYINQH